MSDPEDANPYQTPNAESESLQGSENTKPTFATVGWLFVVPFLLAHFVYWPIFLIGLAASDPLSGMFIGTGALLAAGAAYGVWLGLTVRSESFNSLHPAVYAAGQALWFLFSVVAPCGAWLTVNLVGV